MYDATLIVDQDKRYKDATQRNQKIDPYREAASFGMLVRGLGPKHQLIALVSEDDEEGLEAYHEAGFRTTSVNDDRSAKVRTLISEMQDQLDNQAPKHMVVSTTDAQFSLLCDRAAKKTDLQVWASCTAVPAELTRAHYNYRPLEEILPDIKVPRVDVRLDYENLQIGLEKRGWTSNPKALIDAVKAAIADLGEVVNIVAYADWDLLSKSASHNIQRELARIGVETRYQINMRGKNSADMKMADDIRTVVERRPEASDAVDVIVLGTCDRDFRPTVEAAKARSKKLVIVALAGAVSQELRHAAGDEVRYLDSRLNLPTTLPQDSKGPMPWDEHALLGMKLGLWLHDRRWKWARADVLTEALAAVSEPERRLERAIADKVLMRRSNGHQGESETLMLNGEHPLVQTIRRLIWWVPGRLDYCLNEKGMPYVDSNFLARGMTMDAKFAQLGVGQDRREAEGWLDLVAEAGLIVKRFQPHPKTPANIISTWWLPQKRSGQELVTEGTHERKAEAIEQGSTTQKGSKEAGSATEMKDSTATTEATPHKETEVATDNRRPVPEWSSLALTTAA